MQICVRTPDIARRFSSKFDNIAPDWAQHKRLKAIGACFGFDGWEHFVAASGPQNPRLVFDQDLAGSQEVDARYVEQAKNVARVMGVHLPHAVDLIRALRPLSDIAKEPVQLYSPSKALDEELQSDGGLWWVNMREEHSILSPFGLELVEAANCADLAKARLKRGLMKDVRRCHVLLPTALDSERPFRSARHTYFRSGEYLEIYPIPLSSLLIAPSTNRRALDEFVAAEYPELEASVRSALVRQWTDDTAELLKIAGLPKRRLSKSVQVTVSGRKAAGRSWHWPLRPKQTTGPAYERAEIAAQLADELLREQTGKTEVKVIFPDR